MNIEEKSLGKLVKQRRQELGLSQKELAELLGYKKIVKGIRRIEQMERGRAAKVVASKMMAVLGISEGERVACYEEDYRQMQAHFRANPIVPHLIVRLMAAVYCRREVPDGLSEEELLDYVIEFSAESGFRCCLMCSHWLRFWVDPDGKWRRDETMGGGPWARPDVGVLFRV